MIGRSRAHEIVDPDPPLRLRDPSRRRRRNLAFRDHLREHPLREHPDVRDAYGRLKRDLAEAHTHDLHTYTDASSVFIREMEDRSGRGAEAVGGHPGD
jgi:GrpB-like predicted nucleotidyltransferase (UPF0157 family)